MGEVAARETWSTQSVTTKSLNTEMRIAHIIFSIVFLGRCAEAAVSLTSSTYFLGCRAALSCPFLSSLSPECDVTPRLRGPTRISPLNLACCGVYGGEAELCGFGSPAVGGIRRCNLVGEWPFVSSDQPKSPESDISQPSPVRTCKRYTTRWFFSPYSVFSTLLRCCFRFPFSLWVDPCDPKT